MARPREFDMDEVLQKAADVFRVKGYHATSLDELMEGMGLTKGSVYKAFKDKHAIFVAALKKYSEDFLAAMAQSLERPGSPLSAIRATLHEYIQNSFDEAHPLAKRGCLLTNTAIELGGQDREVVDILQWRYRVRSGMFALAIERAKTTGELSVDADSRALGEYLEMMLHGLRVLIRMGLDEATLKVSVDQAMKALQ